MKPNNTRVSAYNVPSVETHTFLWLSRVDRFAYVMNYVDAVVLRCFFVDNNMVRINPEKMV